MKRIFGIRTFGASLILYLAFSTGCYYDQVYVAPIEGPVSYSANMQPFFDTSCVSCHGGSVEPDLSSPGSYDALFNGGFINTSDPASSLLYTKIAPGGSMATYSSAANTAMTLQWIEEGALNN